MAETVRTMDYFYLMVPDKPGEGARILGELKSTGVNLIAYSGFPEGREGTEMANAAVLFMGWTLSGNWDAELLRAEIAERLEDALRAEAAGR